MLALNYILLISSSLLALGAPTEPIPISSSLTLLNSPKWIKGVVDEPVSFTKEDKNLFQKTLTGVTLGSRKLEDGGHNDGIWTMSGTYKVGSGRKFSSFFKSPTKYEGETLILKVLAEKNDAAIGEAKALKIAKRLVDSGMLKDPKLATSEPKPVIIMKEVSGLPLYKNPGYRASKPHLRDELKKQTFKMMCEKIATIALGTGVLLTDTKPSNVLVNVNAAGNSITSVDMVDFGPPSTYFLKNPKPTKKELLEFCGSEPLSGKYHSWIGQFDELAPHIPPPQKKKTY